MPKPFNRFDSQNSHDASGQKGTTDSKSFDILRLRDRKRKLAEDPEVTRTREEEYSKGGAREQKKLKRQASDLVQRDKPPREKVILKKDNIAAGSGRGEGSSGGDHHSKGDEPYGNIDSAIWYNTHPDKRWKLVRHEKNRERADEWINDQSNKTVTAANIEKGLDESKNSSKYIVQHLEREKEIESLRIKAGISTKHPLIQQMAHSSYELYSFRENNDAYKSEYKTARAQLIKEFSDALPDEFKYKYIARPSSPEVSSDEDGG